MRISDWSSDVCSSDLILERRAPVRIAPVALPVAPVLAILLPRIAQVAAFAADIVPVAVAPRLTNVALFLPDVLPVPAQFGLRTRRRRGRRNPHRSPPAGGEASFRHCAIPCLSVRGEGICQHVERR